MLEILNMLREEILNRLRPGHLNRLPEEIVSMLRKEFLGRGDLRREKILHQEKTPMFTVQKNKNVFEKQM